MPPWFGHRYATLALLAVTLGLLPLVFPSTYYFRVASLVWVSAFAAIGLNILMGQAGQVSLGHAGFFGVGAYAVAIGPTHLGMPVWAALLAGAAISAGLAYLVGRPILRLKGHYPRHRNARARRTRGSRDHHRKSLDRRSRRHVRCTANVVWVARQWIQHLVLDIGWTSRSRNMDRPQSKRDTDRACFFGPLTTARLPRVSSVSTSAASNCRRS